MKLLRNIFLLGVILSLILSGSVLGSELVDPDIPDSWYEAPELASELGLTDFNEAPMLKEEVDQGELPEVEKRLPDDPPVIEVYDEIGKYGGTLNGWATTLDSWDQSGINMMMGNGAHYGRAVPDGSKVVPYMMKDWEWSNEGKTLTLFIREGTKWSDGEPFTSEDFEYWWEYEANNEDLNPVPPEKWNPPIVKVESDGKYKVNFHYEKPVVAVVTGNLHSYMQYGVETPSHYNKKFHPEIQGKEKIEEQVEEEGFDTWTDYYENMTTEAEFHPEKERPTLRPYVVTKRTTNSITGTRNPYFMFVDEEGNQLPYVDEVKSNLANDMEMLVTKMSTGEADIQGRRAETKDLPLFKNNQEQYNYKVLEYTLASRGILIGFNLTHKDPEIREVFQDVNFRRAMSMAINREDINETLYFDQGTPSQFTHLPTSSMYKEEFSEAYAKYKPEKAKELLDEIGLVDNDDDGFRELPNGEEFNPSIMYMERYGPATNQFELVQEYWRDIGIDLDLDLVDESLWEPRKMGNEYDIAFFAGDNGVLPISAAAQADKYFPVGGGAYWNPWPSWSNWYESGGEEGEEPPSEIKENIKLLEEFKSVSGLNEDWIDKGVELLEKQSENLWSLGMVGLVPKPIIINENLKNIPSTAIYNDGVQRTQPLYPVQFYLDE